MPVTVASTLSDEAVPLSTLPRGARGVVARVVDGGDRLGDSADSTVARRLMELGFVPGATVEVLASMWPRGNPQAVRVGGATFALRRRESSAVLVNRIAATDDAD